MITHELMRELLQDELKEIQDMAAYVPNEIVYKALIIREYMKEHGIEDRESGIRRVLRLRTRAPAEARPWPVP